MKTVLIIDDNEILRLLLTDLLTDQGLNTLTAENGWDGVELAQSQQPDLIFCDVHMPRMNGFEVLQKLRNDAFTAHIPFFFMTSEPRLKHYRHLGANGLLLKPLELNQLYHILAAEQVS